MSWLRTLAICCCCLLLLPHAAQAAPPPQTISCDIGGVTSWLGISSPYIPVVRERRLAIENHELTLRICAPDNHAITAEQLLDVLDNALPQLSKHAGVPLGGGSLTRDLLIAPEQPSGNDDQGFDTDGIIRLWRGSPTPSVLREGARYWANEQNFAEPWMIDGYAEYLAQLVDPSIPQLDATQCPNQALVNWPGNGATPECARQAGAAVFHTLAGSLGEPLFRDTLGQLRAQYGPLGSWQLLGGMARASGKNLVPIFRGRVFPPDATPQLDQFEAMLQRFERIAIQARQNDLPPPTIILDLFAAGQHEQARILLDRLEPVLSTIGAINTACAGSGLKCTPYWQPLPATDSELTTLLFRLHESQNLLSRYASLKDSADSLNLGLPESLSRSVATLQPAASAQLLAAHNALLDGKAIDSLCGSFQIECRGWRAEWALGQFPLIAPQHSALITMLQKSVQLERSCNASGWPCAQAWRADFKRSNNPGQTSAFIDTLSAALPLLKQQGAGIPTTPDPWRELLGPLLGPSDTDLLRAAQIALASGDLTQARILAGHAQIAHSRADRDDWLWLVPMILIAICLIVLVSMLMLRRRPPRNHTRTPGVLSQMPSSSSADKKKSKPVDKKAA